MTYRLTVHKIEQSCLFELTWGQGQRIPASLPFPKQLMVLYQSWRRAYSSYYQQALRGRVAAAGQGITTTVDWHSQVVQAEARLLSDFHTWLRHADLFEIRAELVRGAQARWEHAQQTTPAPTTAQAPQLSLFLSCTPLDITRLPWETWEIGADLGQQGAIQIVRSPAVIRAATPDRQAFRQGKTRVLAILGDDRGLNFEGDRQALDAQKKSLDIHYVGWQPGQDATVLKETICRAIADPQGWDILFFAGHSNESAGVDGQIAIAPHTALAIQELTPYLNQAKQRGLQFALFNSCSGLDIANRLVDLGLSQVAVMREPIHNDVAHSFLQQFLQAMAAGDNTQTALSSACQFLKLEKQLTYPSAYLVPSLFRHPESQSYRMPTRGWQAALQPWRPRREEAIALGLFTLLSLLPPVNAWLHDQRLLLQARYRHWTGQTVSAPPPVFLVQIDDRTLQERQISVPNPIDRTLLADLVATLTKLQAPVIGLDYLLDRPHGETDTQLQQVFQTAAAQERWLVLATKQSHLGPWLPPSETVASPNWSLTGNILTPDWHLPLRGWSDQWPRPFSYQLATAYRLATLPAPELPAPQPDLAQSQPLQGAVNYYLEAATPAESLLPAWATLHPVTNYSYLIQQHWLQPLLDFSLPPYQLYDTVPAWQLLQSPQAVLDQTQQSSLQNKLVIIAPGGYDEAGFTQQGEDNLEPPRAVSFWYRQRGDRAAPQGFTGGEIHAYASHHLLQHHGIVPIPALWLMGLSALVSKGTLLLVPLPKSRLPQTLVLISVPVAYGLLSLQLYVSGAVLLPWLLPTAVFMFYVSLRQRKT